MSNCDCGRIWMLCAAKRRENSLSLPALPLARTIFSSMAVSVFLGLNGVFRRPLRRLGAGVFADDEGEGGDLAEGGGNGEEEAGDGLLAAVLRQLPAACAD